MSRAVPDEILTHLTISGLFPVVVVVAQPFQTIRERIVVSRAVPDEILTHLTISGLFPVVVVAQPFSPIR